VPRGQHDGSLGRILGFLDREMSTKNGKIIIFLGIRARSVYRDDISVICEPTVYTMWNP
jgi:hypothetical protein